MKKKNIYVFATLALFSILGCQKKELSNPGSTTVNFENANFSQSFINSSGGTDYFVDAAVSSSGDGKSLAHAFKTLQEAANAATTAGDHVYIQSGIYSSTATDLNAIITIKNNGAINNPIVYQAYNMANKPKIQGKFVNNFWKTVMVQADHIVINGLEVIGEKDLAYTTSPNSGANYRTNGIQVGADNKSTTHIFDVAIMNCKVHDFPGEGIACKYASQLNISYNEVFNNSWYSLDKTSGISILLPTNSGTALDGSSIDGDSAHPKNLISHNVCYFNICKVEDSDGSGIIVDVNRISPDLIDGAFKGHTRVENNICANNGGGGITVTEAQNVEIVNNITRNNRLRIPTWGEVHINKQADNVTISNNIFSASASIGSGLAYYVGTDCTKINCDYNLFFPVSAANNPKVPGTTNQDDRTPGVGNPTSNVNSDPLFVAYLGAYETAYMPATPPTYNEFKVSSTSPAKNTGTNKSYRFYAYKDFLGADRVGQPDKGAFEVP